MKTHINIYNRHHPKVESEIIKTLATKLWKNESQMDAQFNIILVGDKYIQKLNHKFLNKNTPTDVIAFPLNDAECNIFEGEIYISLDRVVENSKYYKIDFKEELYRLVAHGLLHFAGYEDKSINGKQMMQKKENSYLKNLSLQV